jgi:alpha-L-arabinofuranosidase
MSQASIRLWTELPKARINPNIYGHFAEHLGRCIYEGIWVGQRSRIPNEQGMRLDVLAALKQLRAPVVRWPGGCFADAYHWRDGIGPVKDRPQTVNVWWKQAEPNAFGTDEFMRFCQAAGCEPYICLNVGSGTPQEALEWLEYCNFKGESTLTAMRAVNGSRAPYGVKYWGVGNENWGCGGRFTAKDYAKEYVRYATYLKALDPDIELIACGAASDRGGNPVFDNWNHDFCEEMRDGHLISHLSIHKYFGRGKGTAFTDAEYHALFGDLLALEHDIQQAERVLSYFYPDKSVGLIVDEWGMWHPNAVTDNGLEQKHTLRDAVFCGACLNLFNRYAHRVVMANIAQTINVLQCMAMTEGARMYLTPTYHVFDMMRPHMGARLLTQEIECPEYESRPAGMRRKQNVPNLSVSASLAGKRVFITVANQTVDQNLEASICLRDANIAGVTGRVLNSAGPRDTNSFKEPKTVAPKRLKLEAAGNELIHTFPAHSFTALAVTLG